MIFFHTVYVKSSREALKDSGGCLGILKDPINKALKVKSSLLDLSEKGLGKYT